MTQKETKKPKFSSSFYDHVYISMQVGKKCTYFVNCVVEVHKPRRITRVPKFPILRRTRCSTRRRFHS